MVALRVGMFQYSIAGHFSPNKLSVVLILVLLRWGLAPPRFCREDTSCINILAPTVLNGAARGIGDRAGSLKELCLENRQRRLAHISSAPTGRPALQNILFLTALNRPPSSRKFTETQHVGIRSEGGKSV